MLITLAVANALVFGVFDVILEAHTNNQFFKVCAPHLDNPDAAHGSLMFG